MRNLHLIALLGASVIVLMGSCKKDKKQSLATISTTAVSGITATEAQSGGTIADDGGSSISQKGICWSTEPEPDIADSTAQAGAGNAGFTASLARLQPNTTYYVRAFAMNAEGTAYGNELSFTTNAGIPTVTTAAVTDIAPLTAKGGGNVTNNGGAPVTARGICWSTSPNPTIANFKTEEGAGDGAFVSSLGNLASETMYYVRAYATNSHGTAYGNEVTFRASSANTVTDIDGNVYPYITIDIPGGAQTWMTSNLKTAKYQNGDPITDGSASGFSWSANTAGAYTYPNGDIANNAEYGKYYNVLAVNDSRGVCPTGWHVPSDDEWKNLEIYLGMSQEDANLRNFRGTIGDQLMVGGSSGLNLQKGGRFFYDLYSSATTYSLFQETGAYWSSTIAGPTIGNYYRMFNLAGGPEEGSVYRQYSPTFVLSVRCIRN